ncbi:MAG: FAD binding domain-containing protein [Planctomycetes bacterium]|nr:FAD binding domain-containing protein [Planctomycetota bacterium]MCB9910092.1 FAD binding domain-containing protein [Planctomycetota bacterium]MCB9913361.1 FAD binding domain-containing protein [Planctomycetota bacterium]HPF15134.1 FAD binding domain-containing protein [Planctomycetota bacterium]
MLRLPQFELIEPSSLYGALAALAEHGPDAMVLAGGTDLLPNMKHGLFEPRMLVSLAGIEELRGVQVTSEGGLSIGAMTPLADVADHPEVRRRAPALAQAAGLVAGPQLRSMGTLGGNVMLDTRCQWYNQTHFWRQALGFCLKKDGTVCHVVAGGKRCVAAASNDSVPALTTLGASLRFERLGQARTIAIDELWHSDGANNKRTEGGEILTRIEIPATPAGHLGAYGKLRDRGSIDFPLLGMAVRLDLDDQGLVEHADQVVVALVARPVRIKGVHEALLGLRPGSADFEQALVPLAEAARRQCRPMANIPGDEDWRREMVAVFTRRTFLAAAEGASD